METVAVFGVGLIGGSFALALRKAGFRGRIIGVSSPSTLAAAQRAGAIDEALDAETAARQADLIYLAQPIARILDTIGQLESWVRSTALVTDAGSTKVAIVRRAHIMLRRCPFLGGHPLAGKESRGVESADADLFRGRTYVLTPQHPSDLESPVAVDFIEWLRRAGAEPLITTAQRHDEVVAYTSHLPQLASTALTLVAGRNQRAHTQLRGPALVDSTRLALSPFAIWRDILLTNREQIDRALGEYIEQLEELRASIASREMEEHFLEAASLARTIRQTDESR
jgi:prephenate dehydrogenase